MMFRALIRHARHALAVFAFIGLSAASTGASAQCISGVSNADVFAFAEAYFPGLFPASGRMTGRIGGWDYAYYPGTGTYLGVLDLSCALGLLGPMTGGALVSNWTVSTFAAPISSWRASTGNGNSLVGNYNGRWTGTCPIVGTIGGTFAMTVTSGGGVSGTFTGADSGTYTGTVDASGMMSAAGGSTSSATAWSGTIRAGGTGSGGSWNNSNCTGTWSIP